MSAATISRFLLHGRISYRTLEIIPVCVQASFSALAELENVDALEEGLFCNVEGTCCAAESSEQSSEHFFAFSSQESGKLAQV